MSYWTKSRPEHEGWYQWRLSSSYGWEPFEVEMTPDGLQVRLERVFLPFENFDEGWWSSEPIHDPDNAPE